MNEEEKINLVKKYIDAYNDFDVEGMLACLSEQVSFQNISGDQVTHETNGLKNFEQQAVSAKNLFSEREMKIEDVFCASDFCEVAIDYTGKLARDLSGEHKVGDTIKLKGKSIYEFADGKICRIRDIS